MSSALRRIAPSGLRDLARAIESGSIRRPWRSIALQQITGPVHADAIAAELDRFGTAENMGPAIALSLRLLADEKESRQQDADAVELVWTGPEVPGARTRDTAIVVRELFASAQRSVLVSSFAVFQGQDIFEALGRRMDEQGDLDVQLFLNVGRTPGDLRAESAVVAEFAQSFRAHVWPGRHLPRLYYDPRALLQQAGPRACLHAKCVVADERRVFVTSANFTEAAHARNVEAGILLSSKPIAGALIDQFESLVAIGELRPIPTLG